MIDIEFQVSNYLHPTKPWNYCLAEKECGWVTLWIPEITKTDFPKKQYYHCQCYTKERICCQCGFQGCIVNDMYV